MFSYVMLGAKDIQESKKFYDAVFATMGCLRVIDSKGRAISISPIARLAITLPIDGEDPSHGNGSVGTQFAARTTVPDAWHAAGVGEWRCDLRRASRHSRGWWHETLFAYLDPGRQQNLCPTQNVILKSF